MILIENSATQAFFNMAMEEYIFEKLPKEQEYFMFWQNKGAVVVGRYQDTLAEIHEDYVRRNGVEVVRRLSGGGAMYQDMGNLNFTFVVDQKNERDLCFDHFIDPIVRALRNLGADAERSSRNDILVAGMKVSGNAQYNRRGRTMHHGTLLFDSKLDEVGLALNVGEDKLRAKGVPSVRSRVTNICPHLSRPMTMASFREALLQEIFGANGIERYEFSADDLRNAEKLRDQKYATWQWNYGISPSYTNRHSRRFPIGKVEACIQANRGKIQQIRFAGDFFGNGELSELEAYLMGCELSEKQLLQRLAEVNLDYYISGLTPDMLVSLLMQSSDSIENESDVPKMLER